MYESKEYYKKEAGLWKEKAKILQERFDKLSPQMSAQVDGKWVPAKQEPYYNMGIERLLCMFGFHELVISKKYRGTKYCFRCGTRRTGYKHY